jgi:hypothetical protein
MGREEDAWGRALWAALAVVGAASAAVAWFVLWLCGF